MEAEQNYKLITKNMKEWLQRWLGIPKACKHECKCISLEDIKSGVGELLQQYSNTVCVTCDKPIVAHYGGWYRNSEGKVYCSHACIKS